MSKSQLAVERLLQTLISRKVAVVVDAPSSKVDSVERSLVLFEVLTHVKCEGFLPLSSPKDPFVASVFRARGPIGLSEWIIDSTRSGQFAPPQMQHNSPVALFFLTNQPEQQNASHLIQGILNGYTSHSFFISDTAIDEVPGTGDASDVVLPNVIDSGCTTGSPNEINWCKTDFMLKYIRSNPDLLQGYKWFLRFNLADSVSSFTQHPPSSWISSLERRDSSSNSMFGSMFCHPKGFSAVRGEKGIAISRAFFEKIDWSTWTRTPRQVAPMEPYDTLLSRYCMRSTTCRLFHNAKLFGDFPGCV